MTKASPSPRRVLLDALQNPDLSQRKFEGVKEALASSYERVSQYLKFCAGAFSASLVLMIAVLTQVIGKLSTLSFMADAWILVIGLFILLNIGLGACFYHYTRTEALLESLAFLKCAKVLGDRSMYMREASSLRRRDLGVWLMIVEAACFGVAVILYLLIAEKIAKALIIAQPQ